MTLLFLTHNYTQNRLHAGDILGPTQSGVAEMT